MPELLWKAYIDFETEEGEREKARSLYERLLALSGHVKVWISYALFEATPLSLPRAQREEEDDESEETAVIAGDLDTARQVFERGYKDLKNKGLKPEVCTKLYSLGDRFNHDFECSVLPCWRVGKPSRNRMVRKKTSRRYKICSRLSVASAKSTNQAKQSKVSARALKLCIWC